MRRRRRPRRPHPARALVAIAVAWFLGAAVGVVAGSRVVALALAAVLALVTALWFVLRGL